METPDWLARSASCARSARTTGWKRSDMPTSTVRSEITACSTTACAARNVEASGFSTSTCPPPASAVLVTRSWAGVGVATTTRCTSFFAASAAKLSTVTPGTRPATSSARDGTVSSTVTRAPAAANTRA